MKKIPFNTNEYVLIKITEYGYEFLKKQYLKLRIPKELQRKFESDKNGYTKMQLHDAMATFGESMHISFPIAIEPNIILLAPSSKLATLKAPEQPAPYQQS